MKCKDCNVSLDDNNWTIPRRERNDYRCTACVKAYGKRWREENPKRYLWCAAQVRARRNNIPFDITPEDFEIPDRCPVFDIPLLQADGKRQPSSPSLDRIDASKGYVKGNVEIISWRANDLKKDATPEELSLLSNYVQQRLC